MTYLEESAWLAGLIEGEGCIYVGKHVGHDHVSVSVNMTDEDVMQSLLQRAGVGSLSGPRINRKPGYKPQWLWQIHAEKDVFSFLQRLLPYLGNRRKLKAELGIATLEKKGAIGGLGKGRHHRAKTHCRKGHLYDEANTYIDKRGTRVCRACRRNSVERWKQQDRDKFLRIHREAVRRYREKQKNQPMTAIKGEEIN